MPSDASEPAAAPESAPESAGAADPADGPAADGDRAPEGRRRTRSKRRTRWWEWPVLVLVAVLVAFLVKTFVAQPFFIPSDSMEKTLRGCPGCNGDRIVVNKPIYSLLRDPHPGDIVVFRAPTGWPDEVPDTAPPSNPVLHAAYWLGQVVGVVPPDEKDIVKRVVAVGGQTVKCCDAHGDVQVGDDGPDGAFRSLDARRTPSSTPAGRRRHSCRSGP